MEGKPSARLIKKGVIGSVLTMLCCATPVLTFTLGILGLGAVTGYLDYVLFPILAVFLGITIYGLRKRRLDEKNAACGPGHCEGGGENP